MIVLFLVITLGILIGVYMHYKDISHPTVISGIIWSAVYILLLFVEGIDGTSDIVYGDFLLAYIAFTIGNIVYGKKRVRQVKYIRYRIYFNRILRNLILVFEYLFSIILLICCIKYAVQATSLWTAVRRSSQLKQYNLGIYAFIQTAIPMVFLVFWGIFLFDKSKENKKNFLISIPPLCPVMLFLSRGGWFFIIITVVFMYIFIERPKQKKILKYGILGFISIMLIFLVSTLDKYSNAWVWMSNQEKLKMMLKSYFLNPAIAYVNWYYEKTLLYGQNTFRFFISVIKKMGVDVVVATTVSEFVETNGIEGNVYTVLRWYVEDFGLWWAIVIQFILGMIYGRLYRKSVARNSLNIKSIIWISMLMFPLINQFFDDKYTSIFSIWLQRGLWLYLLTKKGLCIDIKGEINFETEN